MDKVKEVGKGISNATSTAAEGVNKAIIGGQDKKK